MTASEWHDAPGKYEDDAEYAEDPDGNVDWLRRKRHATQVKGSRIHEQTGTCVRDYDCGCPGTKPDGGLCVVGKRRCCAEHASICAGCGRICCGRHLTRVNGLPYCHNCYRTELHPDWVIYLTIAFLALVLLYHLNRGG